MESYQIQIDVDPEDGITLHLKMPEGMAEHNAIANEIELYQALFEIVNSIAKEMPRTLLIHPAIRRAQIEELVETLRFAFIARAGMAADGLGALSALSPMPHVPALLSDPAAGCAALSILVNELMEQGVRFSEKGDTPPCIDDDMT